MDYEQIMQLFQFLFEGNESNIGWTSFELGMLLESNVIESCKGESELFRKYAASRGDPDALLQSSLEYFNKLLIWVGWLTTQFKIS